MNKKVISAMPTLAPSQASVLLQAEPEPLEIDLKRTAVIVIDMQNALLSKDGIFDKWGFSVLSHQKAVEPIKKINSAARSKGCKVIYITHCYSPDLRDSGGPNSPNWYKARSLKEYLERPDYRDKLTILGTWGGDIVNELKPEEGDIILEKQRYSAFFGTNLSMILKTYDIRYLLFAGVFTNICVEASIRDAFYHDYFPVLISDATVSIGPPFMQEATIFNVKFVYGWVTSTQNILDAIKQQKKMAGQEFRGTVIKD